ncbi:MAG: DUF4249 domain-containing protein [Saprospiraceae bacterium]|nr:DUF4249 domain-containing protein [Saprospiraceae bacterium]
MRHFVFILISILWLGATSCNLEKEVDIELPEYLSEPVVECYLEPGKPYRLLLTRAFGYFDAFDFGDPTKALINDATVIVRYKGVDIVLNNQLYFDPLTGQFANYGSTEMVPFDYQDTFQMEILLSDGALLTAKTRIMPVVPIDSVVVDFNTDSMARVLTYFREDQSVANYYRRMLNFGSLDSTALQDFLVKDDFFETEKGVFGSGYNFLTGDTLIQTLVHIDRDYYDYVNSINQSVVANINPFGQPGIIISNIEGTRSGIGIFSGLSYFRDTMIIP